MKNIIVIISILLAAIGITIDILPNFATSTIMKFITYILPMLLIGCDMIYQIKQSKTEEEKKKIRKKMLWILFIIYIVSLASLVFFSGSYRNMRQKVSPLFSKENIEQNVNLIPFKTILEFLTRYKENTINLNIVIVNIIGNIVAFMPFGFFIPMLLEKKINNAGKYLCLMIGIIIGVELIQFVTRVGQADIDDLILNLLGAIILYGIIKNKKVNGLIKKMLE